MNVLKLFCNDIFPTGQMDYYSDQLISFLLEENDRLGINVPITTNLYNDNIAYKDIIISNIDLIVDLTGGGTEFDRLFMFDNTHWTTLEFISMKLILVFLIEEGGSSHVIGSHLLIKI
jgi:hypothetical protein